MSAGPWAELVELAERERELAAAGRWEEVAAMGAERARRAALLPPAPASARPHLQRLAALQHELLTTLQTARAATAHELAGLRRGRGAVRGYAATVGPAPALVHTAR